MEPPLQRRGLLNRARKIHGMICQEVCKYLSFDRLHRNVPKSELGFDCHRIHFSPSTRVSIYLIRSVRAITNTVVERM
ncbi:hypothetical protein HanPSC8_Chr17g0779691 [Helianthus annuus]|nr:hypothetical protein HanPSC8_Chr17g0779691 [Helianthus annuus]